MSVLEKEGSPQSQSSGSQEDHDHNPEMSAFAVHNSNNNTMESENDIEQRIQKVRMITREAVEKWLSLLRSRRYSKLTMIRRFCNITQPRKLNEKTHILLNQGRNSVTIESETVRIFSLSLVNKSSQNMARTMVIIRVKDRIAL